ncbi:hypothetical protein TCAL_12122 [Tigriopus californicus]|uniref:Peptidase S1 domain-containing protein n=1 Tax=Tigriopus californicus TaxID=6832 RepID=A0A553PDD9_TIGCA|nr:coagulation factor X-like [Tigriopus californicus]TRY75700.1 hypothetical protein TCAL_12122 [Tigriopus californicus]
MSTLQTFLSSALLHCVWGSSNWAPVYDAVPRTLNSREANYVPAYSENDGYFLAASPKVQPTNANDHNSVVIAPSYTSNKIRAEPLTQEINLVSNASFANFHSDPVHQATNHAHSALAQSPPPPRPPLTRPTPRPQYHKRRKWPVQAGSGKVRTWQQKLVDPYGDHQFAPSYVEETYILPEQSNVVPDTGYRSSDGSSDVLVYEDIYPKRVPDHVHNAWLEQQRNEQELQHLREVEHGRRWRRFRAQQRARRRQDRGRHRPLNHQLIREQRARSHSSDPNDPSLFRSLLGVTPHCLSEDVQFSCTFTPGCWLAGGVPHPGCNSLLYSCCVVPNMGRKASQDITIINNNDISNQPIATGRVQKRRKEILRNEPECGISKQNAFSKRIIGGERAQFAELPWQVHIRISSYQCGGVLLNHWYVATAAHCVHQAKLSQITVHLGEYDTKDTENIDEPLVSESFKVENIVLHPEFRYMLTQPDRYDIALLRLDHPVYYRDNIIPICLPTMDYPLEGKIGVVAGWGKTDNSFGKTGTNLLNKVLVPIIGNQQCRQWHKDKAIAVQLKEEMFCAGHKEGKRDACLGDSGGPLVINFDGQWTLIGITSAGFGCAVEKQPGIYHKVSKTARWIAKQIQKS